MPDTYSSTDIGMAGDRIILAVYLTWYRYQIFPAGYLDRTEYFFILGGLADNLAGYLTGKHDFPCWISSRVLDIPCRISGWIPDITLWISELVITFHITGRVPELFCRIRYLSWYQIFFVQNLAGRVHGIPCWISGQVLACRVQDILGWIGICPGTGYSLPDVRSGHGYSLPGIWPDNKYCYRWIKRRNPVASIQQNPNPVHPVTVWLTLISRALEKNLQLLFKTILHHDAKYFFKNQKWVKNCMTNLF